MFIWGSRSYLVPAERLIAFLADCRSGVEPRSDVHGEYYLRDGDHEKAAAGLPEIPPNYESCLLAGPIEGRIVEILDRHSEEKGSSVIVEVRIDAGLDHGVYKGMLWRTEPLGYVRGRLAMKESWYAQVKSVAKLDSTATFTSSEDTKSSEPGVGRKFVRVPIGD